MENDHRPDEDLFLDYELPQELIAQRPVEPRDSSRLLLVDRSSNQLSDHRFSDLPELLNPGDLLVVNDSKVVPARIHARRSSGGRVELLLLEEVGEGNWRALARPLARLRAGEILSVVGSDDGENSDSIQFIERQGSLALVNIASQELIHKYGRVPLPPYIRKELVNAERYQTVYANVEGSAAAPTAGLHFTPELLERCRNRGVEVEHITLHVGLDTFRPLEVEDPARHKMHSEWFSVPEETWETICSTRSAGKRVVSVGTTTTRVLETVGESDRSQSEMTGRTSIYIRPPFEFQIIGAQITNFHLPRTTLLLMIDAFAGSGLLKRAYEHAIDNKYRFYSFGDAMLIV